MDLLGWWWKYLLTDVTEGEPGNQERMAFLYEKLPQGPRRRAGR
jgi:hypothetical protein